MEYLISCSCGQEHQISQSQAGQTLTCTCGEELQIPTLRGIKALPPAEQPSVAPAAQSKTRTWTGWRGPAMAFCSLLLLVSFMYSAYCFLQAWRNNLGYTTADFIAEGNLAFDAYGPNELSIIWDDFQTLGLKNRVTPTYHLYNLYVEEMTFRATVTSIFVAIMALVCGVIWKTAPRQNTAENDT